MVGYVLDPIKVDSLEEGRTVRIEGGRLLVNPKAIETHWTTYVGSDRRPTTGQVTETLKALSEDGKIRRNGVRGEEIQFREINLEYLKSWVKATEFATLSQLEQGLRHTTALQTGKLSVVK